MRVMVALMAAAVALPGVAFAEEGCQTQAKAMCAPAGAAHLSAATGDVLMSRGTGFSQVKAGAALVAGDRLLVKQGQAQLTLGPSCRTQLGANSMVTLVERNGVLCAARLSSDPRTVAQARDDEQGVDLGTAGLIVGGLTVGVMATIGLSQDSDGGDVIVVAPRLSP